MRHAPSPAGTRTPGSGRASASARPSEEAPPMNPTQVTERSSGARRRHAGAVVIVGTTMAAPRLAATIRRTSSGFIAVPAGATSAGLQPDEDRGRPAARPAQTVVLGNEVNVVRALEPGMGDPEGVEQGLAVPGQRIA